MLLYLVLSAKIIVKFTYNISGESLLILFQIKYMYIVTYSNEDTNSNAFLYTFLLCIFLTKLHSYYY